LDLLLFGNQTMDIRTTMSETRPTTNATTANPVGSQTTPIVDSEGCFVALYEDVLSSDEAASAMLHHLHRHIPWKVESDDYGQQSRPTYYVGDHNCVFTYVGLRLDPNAWTDALSQAREAVETACQHLIPPSTLTACLLNLYPPGQGFIPWHYDEVRAHGGTETIIAALSLGGPRRFQLRKRNHQPADADAADAADGSCEEPPMVVVFDQLLPSGSLLVMKGSKTQECYEHTLPLETGNDKDDAPLRISLTFRSIVPGYEQEHDIATDRCCT
jgi:alkylated DNA repair dioxygenase AlkB